jgi:hypothetical protein
MKSIVRLVICAFALGLGIAPADGATSSGHSSTHSKSGITAKRHTSSKKKSGTSHKSSAKRNSHGRIARSEKAKHAFEVQSGYPHGRPGYVVDHIIPLVCGGPDAPSNMQWQTIAAAKAKDKTERLGCR